jgi:hypothetical protein
MRSFEDLAGSELSGVCFVRDYVEFRFDGPVLRSLASPVAVVDGVRFESPDAGSTDALRQLIGRGWRARRTSRPAPPFVSQATP